jgi:uncharacterized protein (UPF0254 family)
MMALRVKHLTEEEIGKGKLAAIGRYTVDYVSEDNERKVKETSCSHHSTSTISIPA